MTGLLMGVVSSLIASNIQGIIPLALGLRTMPGARSESVEVKRSNRRWTLNLGIFRCEGETETTRIRQTN